MKLTIIGAGNMGSAIAYGLSSSSLASEIEICCTDINSQKLGEMKEAIASIQVTTDNVSAVKDADIVIIAVKPWLVEETIFEIQEALDYNRQIVVSIAAGISLRQLSCFLSREDDEVPAIFRVVPNTAIAVKESVNFVASENATTDQIDVVSNLFDELGLTIQVEERLIAACTALSSCGIAYAFRYIRAAIEGAVELGLYPEMAKNIVLQTLTGAVTLLEANDSHPEAEIDRVTTPGGITIKGLNAMEEAGFTNAVIKGLKASV